MPSFSTGNTFLILSPNLDKPHLTVILCDPLGDPATILTVSFNTKSIYTDPTLILNVGDHPFISRETAVSYDELLLMDVCKLKKLELINKDKSEKDKSFKWHVPVSDELLKRIIDGAFKSDDVPEDIKKIIIERLCRE